MAEPTGDQANPNQASPQGQSRRAQSAPADERKADREAAAAGTATAIGTDRRRRYVVAVRQFPGVPTASARSVLQALNLMETAEIVRELPAPGQSSRHARGDTGGHPGVSDDPADILVIRTDEARGEALRQSAPLNLVVEADAPLRYTDRMPAALDLLGDAMPLPCPCREIAFRILGGDDKPLANASVFLYGAGFPARAVTDVSGQAKLSFYDIHNGAEGEPTTAKAVYVKPAADHWDRLIPEPILTQEPNVVRLRPLSEAFPEFPGKRLAGWGIQAMKRDQLPDSVGGTGIRIGLIDSGCDNTHPSLRHVTNGVDLLATSRPHGWTLDPIGHGTHCAGIITAGSPQHQPHGIMGFAPSAELHVFKVFPGGHASDLIAAFDECIRRQLDIVTINAGLDRPSELVAAKVAQAQHHGVACIAAAGNWGGVGQFPGVVPGLLAVSALGKAGEFPPDSFHAVEASGERFAVDGIFAPSFAGRGQHVGVAAPGVAIVSTVPGGGYAAWDGNAMAAAHIAGFAALLLAQHPAFQNIYRTRSIHRVGALFDCIRAACTPLPGLDPLRIGAGLPEMLRVPGWTVPGRQGDVLDIARFVTGQQPMGVGGAFVSAPTYLASLMQMRPIGMI